MNKRALWVGALVLGLVVVIATVFFSTVGHEENVIGAILPLTGNAASYGVAIKQGIELAREKVNQQGGIHKKQVIVLYEDSKADPKEGVTCAQKLMFVNRVKVIIGAVASSVTLAVAPVAEKAEVVLISPASSSPKITTSGDYIFRNYPSDVLEGELVADFAIDHNMVTASVITINNDYGMGLNEVFTRAYLAAGGTIMANEKYLEGTSDFRTVLTKVKGNSPSCILIVGYSRELGTLIKQGRELGITAQFLSTVNFYDAQSITSGGTAVEGVIFSSPVFDSKSVNPLVQEFVHAFKDRFGKEPDVWSAHGYDAFLLVFEAMNQKGCTAEEIRDGLYSIKSFPGVSGVTTFDSNGDVLKDARFLTVRNGEFVSYK